MGGFTVPLVARVRGRKVGRLLRREFGASRIEDLRLPFFCVSTNLTRGQAAVHRQGELWLWLRASIAIPGLLPPVMVAHPPYLHRPPIHHLPPPLIPPVFRPPPLPP